MPIFMQNKKRTFYNVRRKKTLKLFPLNPCMKFHFSYQDRKDLSYSYNHWWWWNRARSEFNSNAACIQGLVTLKPFLQIFASCLYLSLSTLHSFYFLWSKMFYFSVLWDHPFSILGFLYQPRKFPPRNFPFSRNFPAVKSNFPSFSTQDVSYILYVIVQ